MGGFNPMPNPDLYAQMPGAYISMGETAENVAQKYQIGREAMEELAVQSIQKAAAAQSAGKLSDEIVGVETKGGLIDQDGTIRPDTSMEGLAGLKPAFAKDGTVTAGTSSPLTDGAAATLVCSADYAARNNLNVLASIKSISVAGCDPKLWVWAPFMQRAKP